MTKGELIQILKNFPDDYEILIKSNNGLIIFFEQDIYRERYAYNQHDPDAKTFKKNVAEVFTYEMSTIDGPMNGEKCIVIDIRNSGENYKEIIEHEEGQRKIDELRKLLHGETK